MFIASEIQGSLFAVMNQKELVFMFGAEAVKFSKSVRAVVVPKMHI